MSIHGISPSRIPLPPPPQEPSTNGTRSYSAPLGAGLIGTPGNIGTQPSQTPRTAPIAQPGTNNTPATTQSGRTPQALPATPPPGTDPALWSVLTSDERTHFAKLGAMGPLTYGRVLNDSRTAQIPSARGGRLDVKV